MRISNLRRRNGDPKSVFCKQPAKPHLHGVHHGPIAANLNSLNRTLDIWDWHIEKSKSHPPLLKLATRIFSIRFWVAIMVKPNTKCHQPLPQQIDHISGTTASQLVTISPCHDTMKLRHVWGPSNGTGGLAADLMWFSGQIGRILHFQIPFEPSLALLGTECISH